MQSTEPEIHNLLKIPLPKDREKASQNFLPADDCVPRYNGGVLTRSPSIFLERISCRTGPTALENGNTISRDLHKKYFTTKSQNWSRPKNYALLRRTPW